ncbi:hypothetical protein JCM10213_007233 [Rhodosporidiobolus nylandii]
MPRPLPVELVEKILSDRSLDKDTLARCCRLSRDWLDFSRSRLYSSIRLSVSYAYAEEAGGFNDTEYRYDPQSLALLLSLQQNPHLADLVEAAYFDREGADGCTVYTSQRGVLTSVLKTCTDLEAVGCPPFDASSCFPAIKEHCLQGDGHIRAIDLDSWDDDMWDLLSIIQHTIRHLVYSNREFGSSLLKQPPEPSDLAYLELNSLIILSPLEPSAMHALAFDTLTQASHDSLSLLIMPFTPSVAADFSAFSALTHLELDISSSKTAKVLAAIRTASSLTYLALYRLHFSDTKLRTLLFSSDISLASKLPPRLQRLDLTPIAPEYLADFAGAVSSSALRVLGYAESTAAWVMSIETPPPEPDYGPAQAALADTGILLVKVEEYPKRDYWDYVSL